MIIKDEDLDSLDRYEYLEFLYALVHYYNSLFHQNLVIIDEENKHD